MKYNFQLRGTVFKWSHPARGRWIEMAGSTRILRSVNVPPLAGWRIEISYLEKVDRIPGTTPHGVVGEEHCREDCSSEYKRSRKTEAFQDDRNNLELIISWRTVACVKKTRRGVFLAPTAGRQGRQPIRARCGGRRSYAQSLGIDFWYKKKGRGGLLLSMKKSRKTEAFREI